jgi:hypothetical protein
MKKLLLSAYIATCVTAFSQNKLSLNDSLIGFDEQWLLNSAAQRGITAEEIPVYIALHKRDFINQKYNVKPTPVLENTNAKVMASNCLNEDFENSSPGAPWGVPSTNTITTSAGIVGWMGDAGNSSVGGASASCSLTWCCTGNPTDIQVIAPGPGGLFDPYIGSSYPIYSLFGNNLNNGVGTYSINSRGDFFARINNPAPGSLVNRLTKTINVTSSNSLYQFAYMSIVQMAHCCCDNGGVTIRFTDCSNVPLTVPLFSVTPPQGAGCAGGATTCISSGNPITLITSTTTAGWYWSKWTISSVDLSPYIGSCVKAEVIGYDCPYGGHGAYAYFDSQCDTMHILNNTVKLAANISSVTVQGCASVTNTLSAPVGFSPYLWTGPAGFSTSTLQTISTNIPGTYTLMMGNFGGFAPTIKYITLNHGAIPITTSSSHSILCAGDSAQITASGVGSYTWNTGATGSSIYVKPITTTTYTVNVDYLGCSGTAMVTQSVAICTGLNDAIKNSGSITVFPNPSKGEFNIKIDIEVKNAEIELRNVLGQLVFRQVVKQGYNPIKTENLAKGMYNYSVRSNKEVIYTGKVVIE